jgi:predicted transcriptional regulator
MTRTSADQGKKLLTETELELMHIVWRIGEGSVNDVIKNLAEHRQLAYTSVSTILRILEKKNVLTSRKNGKSHIYTPALSKSDYEHRSLGHLLTNVFSGVPTSLVRTLVDSDELSLEDLAEIKKIISERLDQ